ncbi:MAG: hypothetical protein JWO07_299 [Candidatus Saccharibacteria bacterium]|nr:hypothetical protein [Candidatus Saccharibacteria bacterium]
MIEVKSETEMQQFGERLGSVIVGGEVLELAGDVGAGKTTLVRGIARGMGIDEAIQSPSFTINRVYDAPDGRRLVHYDFYRLADPGIMRDELQETLGDKQVVVVIEWAGTVEQTLPVDRLTILITSPAENERHLELTAGGEVSQKLAEACA